MATRIRTRYAAAGAGLLAALLAVMMLLPAIAHAAESAEGETFLDEGWWLRFREPLAPVPPAGSVIPGAPNDVSEIPRATVRDQTNPYRGEYTRVSTFPGGEEEDGGVESVAAFGFDLFSLGEGLPAIITGGTVTFVAAPRESAPNVGDGANAQRNEEKAAMIACLVTEFFAPDFAGNFEQRPPSDCSVQSPLKPAEAVNGRPSWTMDLAPFTATWADPNENFGFVVVRDPAAAPDGQLFHVAFPNTQNTQLDLEKFPPPTTDITFEKEEIPDFGDLPGFDEPVDAPAFDTGAPAAGGFDTGAPAAGGFDTGAPAAGGFDTGASGGFDTGSSGGFDTGSSGGFDTGSSGGGFGSSGDSALSAAADELDSPAADPETADGEDLFDEETEEAPVAAGPGAGAAAPLAAPGEEPGTPFGLLLIPLLGLALAGTLGYSLTKDPELPLEHEGAVSKLMLRRSTVPPAPRPEI